MTSLAPEKKLSLLCGVIITFATGIISIVYAQPQEASPSSITSNQSDTKRSFNIKEAVFYGLKNNQQMLIALEDIEIARAKIREANALIYPKIDFNLHAAQYESFTPFTLTDTLGSSYYEPHGARSENYTARFMLSQYLYAGGKYTSNMRLAKTNLRVAETTRDILTSKVRAEIKKSFYELLYADSKDKLITEEMEWLGVFITEQRLRNNTAAVQRAQSRLAGIKRESYSSQKELLLAKIKFLTAMGMELNTDFVIDGSLEVDFKNYEVEILIAQSYQSRAELNKVAMQETIDTLGVSLLQAERFPSIMMGGIYEFADANRSDSKKNWAMFVNLNLPIFDGWASWARLDIKKSQLRQNNIRKVDVEDAIASEVRLAHITYESAVKKARYDKELLDSLLQYQTQSVSNNDEARSQIFQQRLNYLASQLEAIVAFINLEKAVGKELP